MNRIKRIKVGSVLSESLSFSDGESYVEGMVYIQDGTIRNTSEGVVYLANDGKQCLFPSVRFSIKDHLGSRAYQMRGVIHIGKAWINSDFSINHFAHEFGHYLQEVEYGKFIFFFKVGIPSFCACGFLPEEKRDHMKIEEDATNRGMAFLDSNLR